MGECNYKFYLQTLLYFSVLALFLFVTTLIFTISAGSNDNDDSLRVDVIILLVLAGFFGLFLILLLSQHIYLLSHNITTIEATEHGQALTSLCDECKKPKKPLRNTPNPYDNGFRQNFIEVFGNVWWKWFLPLK